VKMVRVEKPKRLAQPQFYTHPDPDQDRLIVFGKKSVRKRQLDGELS